MSPRRAWTWISSPRPSGTGPGPARRAPGRFHLLFAGRIQRLKGPQILIKAAALLRARRPDIDLQLTIVGAISGSKDFDLKSLISAAGMDDVVTHHPPVSAPKLAGWYRPPTSW